jgi:hypothetical protein
MTEGEMGMTEGKILVEGWRRSAVLSVPTRERRNEGENSLRSFVPLDKEDRMQSI